MHNNRMMLAVIGFAMDDALQAGASEKQGDDTKSLPSYRSQIWCEVPGA